MPDKLVARPLSELSRVEVTVLSKANPAPGLLRLARIEVQRMPELAACFTQAKQGGHSAEWLRDQILPKLEEVFPGEAVQDVATFLADEYLQIGDAVLLISAETGRAIARITDADMYQPAALPRESGNMVLPAKRLQPHLEGLITQWVFDRSQEQEVVEKILARVPQTQLQREEGDSRGLAATRAGRGQILTQVREALPTLLGSATGVTQAFLDFFPLGRPKNPSAYKRIPDLRVFATAQHLLQDSLARNLRQDVRGSILATSSTGWVRGLAGILLQEGAARLGEGFISIPVEEALQRRETGLWVASPNVAQVFRGRGVRVLPVLCSREDVAVYLTESAGYLEVEADAFWARSRELHDRWTVETEMAATLWVDWSKVTYIPVRGVFPTGVSIDG